MSLYLKHRPQSFDEVLGNEETIEALKDIVSNPEEAPHSYLFHGPTGTGKTTLGRILGKELGIKGQDLREMDTADFRGIDAVRDIRKQAHYRALEGDRRMWILDECHMLTNQAMNALLKLLEDTPKHVFLVLCTTNPDKLLKTIKGRCTQFQTRPLSESDMKKLLMRTCKREKTKVSKKVLYQVLKSAEGRAREALQILDQVMRVPSDKRLETAKKAAAQERQSIELCRALLKGEPYSKVRNILDGLQDEDEESVRRHVLGYANSVLTSKTSARAAEIIGEFKDPFYNSGKAGLTYACFVLCY